MAPKKSASSVEEVVVFDDSVVDISESIDESDLIASASLNASEQEQRRLNKRPDISHLKDATRVDPETGITLALFKTGDRIVADRRTTHLKGAPWLDTRVYIVMSVDDVKGVIHCLDEEARHHSFIGLRDPYTQLKLAPAAGNPFNAKEVKKFEKKQLQLLSQKRKNAGGTSILSSEDDFTNVKRRGRPKGTKNRPRDVILAEKLARKEEKALKKSAKASAVKSKKHKPVIAAGKKKPVIVRKKK